MSESTIDCIPELQRLIEFVSRRLSSAPAESASSQSQFERELRSYTMALEQAVHREDLSRLDLDVPGIVVDETRYYRSHRAPATVHTLAGPVSFERTVYRERGGHGGKCLGVVEARIGAIDGYVTLAAARMTCAFVAAVPPSEAERLLQEVGVACPSRSSLDRIPKGVSACWEEDRATHEDRVRILEVAHLPAKTDVASIVLSLDGVMVRMKDAPNTPGATRDDEGPKGHREAASGTVALYDSDGNRLHTVYMARMPESKKVTLQEQLTEELRWMLSRYPDARVVALADGARENWRIIGEIEKALKVKVIHLLDYFHAAQHLDEGLRATGLCTSAVDKWKQRLLLAENGPLQCFEELMAQLNKKSRRSKKQRETIEEQRTYFANNLERMGYARAEEQNIPVGSGVQEAACKTLVSQRMKNSGMSWLHPGGQAILTLRSLQQSERFDGAWHVIEGNVRRPVEVDTDLSRLRPRMAA